MKKFKFIIVLNILSFLPALCLAEDSLQAAVISKVSAEHASEIKSGNFSRRQSSSHASASRSSTALKSAAGSSVSNRSVLIPKSHLNEKREAIKRRSQVARH